MNLDTSYSDSPADLSAASGQELDGDMLRWLESLFGGTRTQLQEHFQRIKDVLAGTNQEMSHVRRILEAYDDQDTKAKTAQKRRTWYAVIVALLAPMAVLFLAIETMPLWRAGSLSSQTKLALIFLQLVILGLAIFTTQSHWATDRTHNAWLPARLRAELLRREFFLYLAQVGPYLESASRGDLERAVAARLSAIVGAEPTKPQPLPPGLRGPEGPRFRPGNHAEPWPPDPLLTMLALEHVSGEGKAQDWRDRLEDHYREHPADFHNRLKPALVDLYRAYRLQNQMRYYQQKGEKHTLLEERYDRLSTAALWLALLVTVLDGVLTLEEAHHGGAEGGPMAAAGIAVWLLAPLLPTVGVFFITLRTFFENQRLAQSFTDQAHELQKIERLLADDLQAEAPQSGLSARAVFEIQRMILRTETVISHELRRWWYILEPERPHG